MKGLKLFFALLAVVLMALLIIAITKHHKSGMGFDSKRMIAEKIYKSIGNVPTRNLRYEDFIKKYPEGDNALYSDIKKLDMVDVDGLMTIL
jgi:hypothetical protein